MRWSILGPVAAGCAVITLLAAAPADAQAPLPPMPPPMMAGPPPASPEVAEIGACLCLDQAIQALRGDSTGKQRSYASLREELAQMDAELARERAGVDVNNPQSVARFRQLLERHDALLRRSSGPLAEDTAAAVARFNAKVNEYNVRCANRPRDPILLGRVQATLSCPRPY